MLDSKLEKEFFSLRDRIIEKEFSHIDDNQRKAVLNNDRNVLVLACPGSGKTTVLINKVLYLVKYGNVYGSSFLPQGLVEQDLKLMKIYVEGSVVSPHERSRLSYILEQRKINAKNIIVITFTKAAALNMKKRFEELYDGIVIPFFGTFHGFFYKVLIKYYGNIRIIESSESYKVISKILIKYLEETSEEKILEIRNNISFLKSSDISIEEFSPNIDKNLFINCYNAYEEYKRERGLLDFDDLQIRCREILLKEPKLLEAYRRGLQYILIDEFQDSDHIQIDLMKLLNKYNSIFAVGDEDQAIYSFRGARPDYMVSFNEDFANGIKLFLSTNYRSTENIVEVSKNLIKNNILRNWKDMFAYKKEKKTLDILNYSDENAQGEDIALKIEKFKAVGGYKYKQFAVIYRTNIESRSLIEAFIRKKIPFKLLDKMYNFFDHFICRDLIAYLKLSLVGDDIDSFIRIINKPFRYISRSNLDSLKNSYIKEDCFEYIKNLESTPVFQIKNMEKLQKDIYNLNKMSLQSAISFIITDLGYIDYAKEYSLKFKIDFDELQVILEEFKQSAEAYTNIKDFLDHISAVNEEVEKSLHMGNNEDCVTLSTIHGVKGMEFKNIFIIDCVEEILPFKDSVADRLEEERRLMYVAMTRAIDNLFICIPRKVRGKHKEPSRFIDECNINVFEHLQDIYKEGNEVIHSTFGKGKINTIDKNVVEIIFLDNMIRKFDIVTLHNRGIIRVI